MPKSRFARTGTPARVPEIKPHGIYSRRAAAQALQIGEKNLCSLIDTGELRPAKLSKRGDDRFVGEWLLGWLESRRMALNDPAPPAIHHHATADEGRDGMGIRPPE